MNLHTQINIQNVHDMTHVQIAIVYIEFLNSPCSNSENIKIIEENPWKSFD